MNEIKAGQTILVPKGTRVWSKIDHEEEISKRDQIVEVVETYDMRQTLGYDILIPKEERKFADWPGAYYNSNNYHTDKNLAEQTRHRSRQGRQ